jgi:hypothetical protein
VRILRHPDFEKIYQAFMWRYCQGKSECEEGNNVYYAWLGKMGLDDTKPYERTQERFSWVDRSTIAFWKQDEEAKYYKVEALFPLSSMNRNVYTQDELVRACRTLIGKPVNLNHTAELLRDVEILDADYEDDTVECALKVLRNGKSLELIEKGEMMHVSIEAQCLRGGEINQDGYVCKGLVFTGLALLTRDVLPGVPLTRIEPVEKLVESFTVKVKELDEKQEKDLSTQTAGLREDVVVPATQQVVPAEASELPETKSEGNEPAEQKEPSACEKATEALLIRVETVERDLAELKKSKEAIQSEPQLQPSPPETLTKEGFWSRFHQLRSEGLSKSDAFRLVSLELLEKANKQSR